MYFPEKAHIVMHNSMPKFLPVGNTEGHLSLERVLSCLLFIVCTACLLSCVEAYNTTPTQSVTNSTGAQGNRTHFTIPGFRYLRHGGGESDGIRDDVLVYSCDAFRLALESVGAFQDPSLSIERVNIAHEFVLLPPGEIVIGSGDCDGKPLHEQPRREVSINYRLLVARTEVVQGVWRNTRSIAGININPREFRNVGIMLPVESVTWNEVLCWCMDMGLRLPTESEWEYACRAGTDTEYYFGNDSSELGSHGWYSGNSSQHTHEVGLKEGNPFGLFDMYGNVSEWTLDFMSPSYVDLATDGGYSGFHGQYDRVNRGGNCKCVASVCRSSSRMPGDPHWYSDIIGFRPVKTIYD